jgi:hypothetical protein
MQLPVHSSNILFNLPFESKYDFTVSFTYRMNTNSTSPTANDGFSVFFIDGRVQDLSGGGEGAGLGLISSTDTTATSAVSGMFLAVGFDITGEFFKSSGVPAFNTGTVTAQPSSVGIRVTSDFAYISSVQTYDKNPYLFGPLGVDPTPYEYQTVRVGVRKNFGSVDVYSLNNETYIKLATFNTQLTTIPPIAKFGISYSGDTLFEVQNITLNYTSF